MILGSMTLHPGVIWINETTDPRAAQQIEPTLLNNVIIFTTPITKREIVLEARDGNRVRGVFTRELVEELMDAEQNGIVIPFVYRGLTRSVIVKAGGLSLTPKRETETLNSDDVYTGTVTLQEV